MKEETKIPARGFYYHYKHDPTGPFNNYAYEIIGLARHSEDENMLVVYRPLYDNTYLGIANCSVRPLEMFNEDVIKDGASVPRFLRILDSKIISELEKIKARMYP